MDGELSVFVIVSTVCLYIFIGFSFGWITFSYRFINTEKQATHSKKKKFNFLRSLYSANSSHDSDSASGSLSNIEDYEKQAERKLNPKTWALYRDGAAKMYTVRENVLAYSRYQLMPKYLVDVSNFSTKTKVLGQEVAMPIGISPTSYQNWAHPDGDKGTAQAAEQSGTVFIASTYALTTLEDIAEATPDGNRWFQLYLCQEREYTMSFVSRAEQQGYRALVVTVDRPVTGIVYSKGNTLGDVVYPNIVNMSGKSEKELPSPYDLVNPGQNWAELKWLVKQTKLPVVLKGIMNSEEVKKAADVGAKAILVSNHGGRVLDGVPATIDVLEEIAREAQQLRLEVYLDGGVRTGQDVFKAIALGALMVFIGRPAIWGLTCAGKSGVNNVLQILNTEFQNTAQLCGAPSLSGIERNMVQFVGRG